MKLRHAQGPGQPRNQRLLKFIGSLSDYAIFNPCCHNKLEALMRRTKQIH